MGLYFGDFADEETVFGAFGVTPSEQDGVSILLAWYNGDCYDGEAMVLLESSGEMYEVNGSHCSCFGVEGQWKPELVVDKELLERAQRKLSSLRDPNDHDGSKAFWRSVEELCRTKIQPEA